MHLYPGPPRRRKKASRPKKRMNTSSQNSSENEIIAISSSSSVESRSRKKRVRVPPQLNDASHDKTQDGGQARRTNKRTADSVAKNIPTARKRAQSHPKSSEIICFLASELRSGCPAPRTSAPQRRAQSLPPRSSHQAQEQQRPKTSPPRPIFPRRGKRSRKITQYELRLLRDVVRGYLTTKFPFASLVRFITEKLKHHLDFKVNNTEDFQKTAEEFIVMFFEDAFRCAKHRGTSTLSIEDLILLRNFRGI